jgi:Co/Zn/Cd efflux system component
VPPPRTYRGKSFEGSALVAGFESVTKLLRHGGTTQLGWGIAAAVVGYCGQSACGPLQAGGGAADRLGNHGGRRQAFWLDALSSAGPMLGLIGVALGWGWADAIAAIIVTGFICHVG